MNESVYPEDFVSYRYLFANDSSNCHSPHFHRYQAGQQNGYGVVNHHVSHGVHSGNAEKATFAGQRVKLWRKILFPHEYRSEEMEKLFRYYAYPSCFDGLRCLLILMIALTVSLSIVNFVFVSRLSLENIANSSLCLSYVVILICLHTRFMSPRLLPAVTLLIVVLCLVFCAVSFAVDEQNLSPGVVDYRRVNFRRIMSGGFVFSRAEAVWRVCYVVFVLYAFVPLRFYVPLFIGAFVSLLHCLLAVVLPGYEPGTSSLLPKQVIANLFIFLIVNVVCAYLYRVREGQLRLIFDCIRSSTALQLRMQDENDKADKLLTSMVPSSIAMEMKSDLQTPHLRDFFQKVYMQQYDNVSILFGDLVGLNLLTCQCSALELVRFLNETIGRFDQLAAENHCQRIQIQGDRYFCISGALDQRPDHAKCCVEMGLDMIDFINFVGNLTSVNLRMRIGIHTGEVTCGVVGLKRWQYDVVGIDSELASLAERASQPGKVLVTSSTMEHLHGMFPLVANRNCCPKLEAFGLKTFFVVSEQSRKHYFLPKMSSAAAAKNSMKNIGGILSSIKFNVELPLSNVVSKTLAYVSSSNSFEDAELFLTSKRGRSTASFSERHKKHLVQLIANKSLKKKRSEYVNYLSLCFKSSSFEKEFSNSEDVHFALKLFLSLIILVMSMVVHAVVLPRTIFLLAFFLICFAWISVILMFVLGYRIKCIKCDIKQSPLARKTIIVVGILLHFVMSFFNTLCCRGGMVFPEKSSASSQSIISFHHSSQLECPAPQYIYLNVLSCLFLVSLYDRLSALFKLAVWLVMSVGYLTVTEFTNRAFFVNYDAKLWSGIPSDAPGILMLLHFLIALYISSRDSDWLYRLKYIWQDQAKKQKLEVHSMESLNQDLFHNLLPEHVVPYFNNVPNDKIIDFYSHSYSNVGIMCASVSNMAHVYNELMSKTRTNDCLRVLNEIISAFDGVQTDPRFTSTVKIKSCGSSCIVAAGLKPNNKIDDSKESKRLHLSILMELLLRMKDALVPVCRGKLLFRAGVDMGPITAGVVGARKPQFELFGDCVNAACCLSSTSLPGYIQVSEAVQQPLSTCYEFQCRGLVKLTGNKEKLTYFLMGNNQTKSFSNNNNNNNNNNNSFKDKDGFVSLIYLPQCISDNTSNDLRDQKLFSPSIRKPKAVSPYTTLKLNARNSSAFNHQYDSGSNIVHYYQSNKAVTPTSEPAANIYDANEFYKNRVEPYNAYHQSKRSSYGHEYATPVGPRAQVSVTSLANNSEAVNEKSSNSAFQPVLTIGRASAFSPARSSHNYITSNCRIDAKESLKALETSRSSNDQIIGGMFNSECDCLDILELAAGEKDQAFNHQHEHQIRTSDPDCQAFNDDSFLHDRVRTLENGKKERHHSDKKVPENFKISSVPESVDENSAGPGPTGVTRNKNDLSPSDLEDINAIMKEIEESNVNCNMSSSCETDKDFDAFDQQDRTPSEDVTLDTTKSTTTSSKDDINIDDAVLQIGNGIIYTKKQFDKPHFRLPGQNSGSQPTHQFYANTPFVKLHLPLRLSEKANARSSSNGYVRAARPLSSFLHYPSNSAFSPVKTSDSSSSSSAGVRHQSSQSFRSTLNNGNNPSLVKSLLAASLNAKIQSHQNAIKRADSKKESSVAVQNQPNSTSQQSTAPLSHSLKNKREFGVANSRCKSLDRMPSEAAEELESCSSLGDLSPKMLHRASNKRNIALLGDVGSSSGENQRQLGSGFLQAKHALKLKVKHHHRPLHLSPAMDSLSLSSFNSEISRSDPALSCESGSAVESEYDNYRPGMASDEDYFAVEPVSDVDIDLFDDINVVNNLKKDNHDYENFSYESLMQNQSNKLTAEI